MPNVFLSGRIPAELNQQIEEFLARTGETKTEMLAKAVAAYIGAEPPPLKVTGDRRIENLELVVAELQGAVKSLYEKLAAITSKTENPKTNIEPITLIDNTPDNNDNIKKTDRIDDTFSDIDTTFHNSDNYVEVEKTNTADNNYDKTDNTLEVTYHTDVTLAIERDKTFLDIETAEVARLTKLDAKKFTNRVYSFNEKFKKQNKPFPKNKPLDRPIKMTPSSGIKIEEIPYDVFYLGQSKEGKHLWNLIPETIVGEELPLPFNIDNAR